MSGDSLSGQGDLFSESSSSRHASADPGTPNSHGHSHSPEIRLAPPPRVHTASPTRHRTESHFFPLENHRALGGRYLSFEYPDTGGHRHGFADLHFEAQKRHRGASEEDFPFDFNEDPKQLTLVNVNSNRVD